MSSEPVLQRDVDVTACNTLALQSSAACVAEITDASQLRAVINFARTQNMPWHVLGGGSNVILPLQLPGLLLLMRTRGITLVFEDDNSVRVAVAAGEVWDDVVAFTLSQGWYGLENLSLIPGSCGAAPVQNIGAYGVEIAQFVEAVEYFDVVTNDVHSLAVNDCEFHYRDSVFKHALRGRAIITCVHFRLAKKPHVNLRYPALAEQFDTGEQPAQQLAQQPTPQQVRAAVIAVRRSKLPDPALLPNVGSFFKNPLVSQAKYQQLHAADHALPCYPQADGSVKLAAGYLVDQCGWKGRIDGPVQVHAKQALVLINRGGATAQALLHTAGAIRADVHKRYGVSLEIEPDIF